MNYFILKTVRFLPHPVFCRLEPCCLMFGTNLLVIIRLKCFKFALVRICLILCITLLS
jgi:hypothetical protein